MNTAEVKKLMQQQKLQKPPPIQRQTNKIEEIEDVTPDVELASSVDKHVEPEVEPELEPIKEYDMFLQGHIMSKSTGMTTLNTQLQQVQNEILERQNMLNEIKSKMLHTQGSIATLHELSAKLRELNLSCPADVPPMMMG